MPTVAEFVSRVRHGLSVDASYEAEFIPAGVERMAKRLLRDYHFPWAVQKEIFDPIVGQQNYPFPVGFKREIGLIFYDTAEKAFSDPLLKRETFTLPNPDGIPRYYWMWNGNLATDLVMPSDSVATTELHLWYENNDWDVNADWLLANFEDILYTLCVFRLAAELGKAELATTFAALWGDDRQALAIYANELQFDNSLFMQREPKVRRGERYPVGN